MKKLYILIFLISSLNLFSQDVLMQNGTVNQCSGVFYDSGGTGDYQNDENYVMTICPDTPGEITIIDFLQFSTQPGADILTIYDGDDVTAPVIGSFSGGGPSNNPGVISASQSNPTGCLTIAFVSDSSFSGPGWEANITCATPCQTIDPSIVSDPPVDGTGVVEIQMGNNINFTGSATFSNDGTGATYEWDFGDGNTDVGNAVSHTFATSGTFTVTLTVTDANPLGCSVTETITVVVLDNDTCAGALPICSGIDNVPSPVGSGSAENGIDYGCLGSQPRPRWYFLQTGNTAGNLDFTLTQYTGQNQTGTGIDVDFIVWGPFSEPVCGDSNLNSSTQVDCSFSASATENINIPNAPANSFYVLLITNYSTSAGYINLELDPTSTADTNCDIICEVDLGDDQIICDASDYTISSSTTGSFTSYEWQYGGVTIPGETNSTITVSNSGVYTLIATGVDAIFGDPCTTQDDIVVTFGQINLTPETITICDNVAPGDDGFGEFDLTLSESGILNGLPAADHTITYYEDATDAETGPGTPSEILTPTAYTNTTATTQIVYVRVENTTTNCYSVAELTLQVDPLPTVTMTTNTDICSGEDAVFTITGEPGHVVDYALNGGATQQATFDASGQEDVIVVGATTDQSIELLAVNNPVTGCSVVLTDTATIFVNPNPTVTLTSNGSTCSGSDAVFTITGTPGDVVEYNINGGATQQVTLDASGEEVILLSGVTTDQILVLELVTTPTTSCNTVLSDSETVTIDSVPSISLTTNSDICSGENAIFTIIGTPGDIVEYNLNGGATQQVTLDASGQADVTVTGAVSDEIINLESVNNPVTGCNGTLTNTATVFVNANPTVTLSSNGSICPNGDAEFTITGNPGDIVDYNINGGATQQVTLNTSGQGVVIITGATSDQTIILELVVNPTTTCSSSLTDTATVTI
ncbi:MAG: PKD domain-containing protein, partial [Algicola sp.]|nr:PKD domain-containing protein [Algicola sp.]